MKVTSQRVSFRDFIKSRHKTGSGHHGNGSGSPGGGPGSLGGVSGNPGNGSGNPGNGLVVLVMVQVILACGSGIIRTPK